MKFNIAVAENDNGRMTFRVLDTFNAESHTEANSLFDYAISDMGSQSDMKWLRLSCIDGGHSIIIREHGSMRNVLKATNSSK